MKSVGLICARSGSKGIPRKNIRLLRGRPLIAWAIHQAREVSRLSRVIVSTDSEEIAAIAQDAGAEVPFIRPSELAQDTTPEWLVWRHAVEYLSTDPAGSPDALLVVPPTAPLRDVSDLERCLNEFETTQPDVVITVTDAHRNPFFNMVRIQSDGGVTIAVSGQARITRRQDAPQLYDITTVAYAVRPGFVMDKTSIFEGRVRHIHVPAERAIDIDTPLDFTIAEYLLGHRDLEGQ